MKIDDLLYVVGAIFMLTWLTKLICYFFDSYEDMGRYGSTIMGTFMMYSKEEIEEEERGFEKVRKRVNNICGYILLTIVSIIFAGLLFCCIFY